MKEVENIFINIMETCLSAVIGCIILMPVTLLDRFTTMLLKISRCLVYVAFIIFINIMESGMPSVIGWIFLVMPVTLLDRFTTSCNGKISCCLSERIFEIFRCLSDELF